MTKRWRQLTVWLHILTSVGWMAQAMTLCVLLAVGLAADLPAARDAATSMAHQVDGRLLAPMAGVSACTGIVLAAATPWGFFLHWWVLIKFAISMVQVYLGIFVLSPALATGPSLPLVIGTALMASAIAFQGWLSVRKPWGTVRRGRRAAAGTGPRWAFVATVLGGLAELALALVLGHPMPLLSLILIIIVVSRRPRWAGSPRIRPAQV
ncbi:hypothetical protein Vqi01_53620 [Micromonospora qiuiae]|uniref:DUF2269 domain-containing protein n=1 Tax=Micromonospora qiuiae TaxID=502268 RepID=A0ABQ4JIL8_9ACTN|nr:hypothetical protein [Micromonospora qiuiae]GIJ30200.1 hypothetical protein Vqi01_53620 [Micromonospora qiuiae]